MIFNRKRVVKAPPFYNVNDDQFYHGPAWVIKPRLFPLPDNQTNKPGPAYYHIPERSIYNRPGITIGSRYDTISPTSIHLLGNYHPDEHYTSNSQTPAVSITPRRIQHTYDHDYSKCLYLPLDQTCHHHTPLLRPLYGPTISRNPLNHNSISISPGPAAYPMYEFDEDILPRPQPGITQKHRFSSDRKISTLSTNPPFYYPNKPDHHRLPSFSIGQRLLSSTTIHRYRAPYYSSIDKKASCSSRQKPGATLKGRWSPLVYIPQK